MSADVTAVILAGGGPDDPLARRHGVPAKALVPVDGRPMIERVAAALVGSAVVERVVCVGSADVRAAVASVRSALGASVEVLATPAGEGFGDSLALGLGAALACRPSRLLLLAGDVPWIRAADVTAFVVSAAELRTPGGAPAALVYPAVPRSAAEAVFPGQRRTWVRAARGVGAAPQQLTGGNLVLLDPAVAPRLLAFAAAAYRARKRPLALARLVGVGTVLGLLSGRLRIDVLERRVGALLGAPVRVLVTDLPTLAADLDRPDQLPPESAPAPPPAPPSPLERRPEETP